MTNRKLLEDRIKQKGLKKGFLAEAIGVSRSTFCSQLCGKTEFKASQIRVLCELLGIEDGETMAAIFFSHCGALKATEKEAQA